MLQNGLSLLLANRPARRQTGQREGKPVSKKANRSARRQTGQQEANRSARRQTGRQEDKPVSKKANRSARRHTGQREDIPVSKKANRSSRWQTGQQEDKIARVFCDWHECQTAVSTCLCSCNVPERMALSFIVCSGTKSVV